MAKAEHIKALVKSFAEGDEARFYSIAMQMAAQAARTGQTSFARELRDLVDEAKKSSVAAPRARRAPVPMVQPRGELAGLLSASYPRTTLSQMVLSETVESTLRRLVHEHRQRDRLRHHGLSPARKLLLIGPPGTGKTMTATALAGEMHLPLFTIVLHALITKFMGETAAKLRLIFDAISETRAVYLFDEFDALGGDRSVSNDVGEIRRVLNSFLQFLEQDDSDSVIVAATNHPKLLDRALWRRFDDVLEYRGPTPAQAVKTMQARLAFLETTAIDWTALGKTAKGLSYAEIVQACEQAAKEAVLGERESLSQAELVSALESRARHEDTR